MTNTPIPNQTDLAVQNNTTGQVDLLEFNGSTLVGSALFDYGISGFNIVAHGDFNGDGHQDLVAQNPLTGAIDLLLLDGGGHLIGSALNNLDFPRIVGVGRFGNGFSNQPILVSQLPNGELDMLGINSAGTVVQSDAITNSIGLPQAVGVGETFEPNQLLPLPAFAGVGATFSDNVILQLGDGSLDTIGFSGSWPGSTLAISASFLLPGSAGLPPVQGINQTGQPDNVNFSNEQNVNPANPTAWNAAPQAVSQLANGQLDVLYFNSGYNDAPNEGHLYASNLLNLALPGWSTVDASAVAVGLFPFT